MKCLIEYEWNVMDQRIPPISIGLPWAHLVFAQNACFWACGTLFNWYNTPKDPLDRGEWHLSISPQAPPAVSKLAFNIDTFEWMAYHAVAHWHHHTMALRSSLIVC